MTRERSEWLYGALAVTGVGVPLSRFIPWLVDNGLDIGLLFDDLFANRISAFFAWDVIISAVVLVCFLVLDGDRLPASKRAIATIGTLGVGPSFGLPLFLFLRARNSHTICCAQSSG